jgi:hypothetical protein
MHKIYEASVETIRETFAVLIGFAVTEFIGDRFKEEGAADFTVWALSLALILLVLRLFIGTANHLETTYAEVQVDLGHPCHFGRTTLGFLKDVGFLIVFGVMSILIARSDPKVPESFLKRTLLLLFISSLWAIVDALWQRFIHTDARRWWRWWLICDAYQFLLTAIVWRWGRYCRATGLRVYWRSALRYFSFSMSGRFFGCGNSRQRCPGREANCFRGGTLPLVWSRC